MNTLQKKKQSEGGYFDYHLVILYYISHAHKSQPNTTHLYKGTCIKMHIRIATEETSSMFFSGMAFLPYFHNPKCMHGAESKTGWIPINVQCRQAACQPEEARGSFNAGSLTQSSSEEDDLDYPEMAVTGHTRQPHPHVCSLALWQRAWKKAQALNNTRHSGKLNL